MVGITVETIHDELKEIKTDIERIRIMLEEDYELSDEAKKELKEARKTPHSKYISQKYVEKRFLRK